MFEVTLRKRGATPKLLRRALNDCHRDAGRWMGTLWHQEFRALHFSNGATRRYGYAPRQGERGNLAGKGFERSYTGRKLRKYGHTRPLVYTGESEQRTRRRDIRVTAKKGEARVRIVLDAPALNLRYRGSSIDMRDEATKVIQPEAEQIARSTGRFLERRYRLAGGSGT